MPRKRPETKRRGLFEQPPESGIWWINYYIDGKQHREKVGTKQSAINLYQKRKQDDREGKKLPSLRSTRFVTLSELIDDALEHVASHKDLRNYKSKAEIVRADLGGRKAEDITPQELLQWLNGRKKSAATYNRYKAFLSLCYRVGEQNSKVEKNPARKAPHKREDNARIRFLSQEDEYPGLYASVSELFPEHVAEFVVSVHNGMRLSEQYTAEWSQYQKDRRAIELSKTKNGHQRTVHLNQDAIDAIESLKLPGQRMRGRIFPREGSKDASTTAHGLSRVWRRPRSTGISGIATATHSAPGSLWRERRRKRFRKLPVTAPSRWLPGMHTCHPLTDCRSWNGSPGSFPGIDMHLDMHQR